MIFSDQSDKSATEIFEVGRDDTIALTAFPTVLNSGQLITMVTGNLVHRTPRAGARSHCRVRCDGREQECCIECGSGSLRTKICC
ncbi:MAG: hypothetical protein WDM81_17575 [Rhizomicrobium sp.]